MGDYFVECVIASLPPPFSVVLGSILSGLNDGGDVLRAICPDILQFWNNSIVNLMCPGILIFVNNLLGLLS